MGKNKEQGKNKTKKLTDSFYASSKEATQLLEKARELRNEKSLYYFQGAKQRTGS